MNGYDGNGYGYPPGYPPNAYQTLVGQELGQPAPPPMGMVPAAAMQHMVGPGPSHIVGPGPWGSYGPPFGYPYGYGCGIPFSSPQPDEFHWAAAKAAVSARGPQTPLPLTTVDTPPGTPVDALPGVNVRKLTTRAVVPICITRYVVTTNCAAFFSILSILATKIEWLDGSQGVPALMLAESNTSPPFKFPSLYPGADISVTVRNDSNEAQHFFSSFVGYEGPGCYPCLGP